MAAVRCLASLSCLLLVLAGCGGASGPQAELGGATMGTTFSVKIAGFPAQTDMAGLRARIEAALADTEAQMSTYIADSAISRFNAYRGTDWFPVPAALCAVVATARDVSTRSAGAFDVTVGPLVNLWGFGPQGSVVEPPAAEAIAQQRAHVGYGALHADCSKPALRKDIPELYVDLSAVAKGYGVDRLAAVLDDAGIDNYLVEIGGELLARGHKAGGERWAIAIEQPSRDARAAQTVIHVQDVAVATSGDYRNYFDHEGRSYSHTIDPRTGYPVTHDGASVTVVAGSAAYADAMATALLVLGPDEGMQLAEREALAAYFLARDDGEFRPAQSSHFAAVVSYK